MYSFLTRELQRMANKRQEIMLLPEEPEHYADPHDVHNFPFRSANLVPAGFSISNEGRISYMGRVVSLRFGTISLGSEMTFSNGQILYLCCFGLSPCPPSRSCCLPSRLSCDAS